ncbi:MAG: DUF1295 domain-containing protein [SAR86 cluster bacterium]|nr:DUF1295 domain-containing protein [SAR86 cluster bacterium]
MSNIEFLTSLYFINTLVLIGLISRSIIKKSPRFFLKFFFISILACTLIGSALKGFMGISEFSNRQILANTMLFIWCIKSISSYRSIKVILLSNFLEALRGEIASKNIFRIFRLILKISLFQFICFSSFISTNYLSGASHLNYLDLLGLVICLLGITLELISEKQLRSLSFKKTRVISTGPWAVSRHPNLIGIFMFFLGMQIIAFSAISSLWSIFGFLLIAFILFQNILPKIEKNLLSKFTEYKTYSETVPKIFYFK